MKKLYPFFIFATLMTGVAVASTALNAQQNNHVAPNDQSLGLDSFDNDPFFQSQNDIFKQMYKMQQAMDQLMRNQFSQMHNSLANQTNQNLFGSAKNIQIHEKQNELIYKVKLPKGADSKINVAVNSGQLIISTNVTQKITREQDSNKTISYAQSHYQQSFQLPSGYDPNSMTTKMKDSNLIVIFKKKSIYNKAALT